MHKVPSLPKWLGLAGLLPQLACLGLLIWGPPQWDYFARQGALLYAALILSFLGGTWWGIAASAPAAERRGALGWIWAASVLPMLGAFAALLWPLHNMPSEPALVALAAALWLVLIIDWRLAKLAPPWWFALRAPLSIGLGAATFAVAIL